MPISARASRIACHRSPKAWGVTMVVIQPSASRATRLVARWITLVSPFCGRGFAATQMAGRGLVTGLGSEMTLEKLTYWPS